MRFLLNFDRDILKALQRAIPVNSEWFKNLPLVVQLERMDPYIRQQAERDAERYGTPNAA